MTPEEQQMIQGLIQRVQNAPVSEKDYDAEQLLQQSLGRNPNSLYVLAQTVLVQNYALEQAQKQLADTKQALDQAQQQLKQQQEPRHATSFLGGLFGSSDTPKPAPPPQQQYTPVPNYSQPPGYGQPQYGPPQYSQPQYSQPPYPGQPPQGGGFLRGAMQTAAGVAAGALAFEGVESLMHGFGGGGSAFGGGVGSGAPREEIINNYYGDDAGREHDHGSHGLAGNDDIEDRRDDAASQTDFADTGDQDAGDADTGDQDTGDDNSFNDDSSFDSGSDDSNFS